MKIIFFGLGSSGLRHARRLNQYKNIELYAFRTGKGQKKVTIKTKEVRAWEDIDRIKPDVAFITNPTSLHVKTALACARRNMDLFIEKPLDSQIKDLDQFLKIVRKKNIVTYVAYVLRFHPVIQELRKYIRKYPYLHMRVTATSLLYGWRPYEDVKKSYSSFKEMGGGVIYDLSHEIDYAQYLLGDIKNMQGQFSRRSHMTVDSEDYADFLIQTQKGPVNIHMNFLSQLWQRIIQVDFKGRTVIGDLRKSTIVEYQNNKIVKTKQFAYGTRECFGLQIKYFLKNWKDKNSRMMNNVFEAAKLLRIIYRFKKSQEQYA